MQIGEEEKEEEFPLREPARRAIPAPDIFAPKKAPKEEPAVVPEKEEERAA